MIQQIQIFRASIRSPDYFSPFSAFYFSFNSPAHANTNQNWLSMQAGTNGDPMTMSIHATAFQATIETPGENWTADIPIRKVHSYIDTDAVNKADRSRYCDQHSSGLGYFYTPL